MHTEQPARPISRRELMHRVAALTGGVAVLPWFSPVAGHAARAQQSQGAAPVDAATQMRDAMAKVPIVSEPLPGGLTMLSGPGGNIAVLDGPDGKIVVDSFVQSVWPQLKARLDGLGPARVTALIDTHWHLDHADNNANFRHAGAAVVAHENTTKRLSETHELLGMRFEPYPPEGLPTVTFATTHRLDANGEQVALAYVPPAHTDTDISIHFARANVLHLGDLFFNGSYPFIDAGTGGTIGGMIQAAQAALTLADARTTILPGHGPVAKRAALEQYRDVLVTVRDRVQKLKTSGRTVDQAVAEKPTADLDGVWGKGFMQPDLFVTIVYHTL